MLFALIFPRAQRASTYDISAERNVWLQSALRSFAIVCDYMKTGLFAIVCDPRSSAIVCDHMETSLKFINVESHFAKFRTQRHGGAAIYGLCRYGPLRSVWLANS